MGVELTSGFDSQLINALQIVPSWVDYFDDPQGPFQGFIGASYSLGMLVAWCRYGWYADLTKVLSSLCPLSPS